MKKIFLVVSLFICSVNLFGQWTSLNTGFPLTTAGFYDKINGMATISSSGKSRIVAATNSKGVYIISIDVNGNPAGSSWQPVPGCPYPNKRVSSIVSTANTFYVCFNDIMLSGIEYPQIWKCVFVAPGSYTWTLLNNTSLPYTSLSNGKGFLALYNNVLFFMDDAGSGPYKLVGSSWQSFTMSSSISSPIYCMKMTNSGTGYVGNNYGIFRFTLSGSTGTYTNVYSSTVYPACVDLIPYVGPSNTATERTKTFFAIVSSFCPGFHACASNVIRYEKGGTFSGPDMIVNIGSTVSSSELLEIVNPNGPSLYNTGELLCTKLVTYTGGGDYSLGKSYNNGGIGSTTDWASTNVTGFPNYQYVSCIKNSGTTSGGAVYIGTGEDAGFASSSTNLGFYYFLNTPLLRTSNLSNEHIVEQLSIFPNPTNQSFKLHGNPDHYYTIYLADIQGKALFKSKGTIEDINKELGTLSNLANGIYLVQLRDLISQENKTEKLIKE